MHKLTAMEVISKEAAGNINLDRISQLPESLIQHILSFLNFKESVNTGFLSKSLFNAWSTRPTLNFDIAYFNQDSTEFILKSLSLYHNKENFSLQKFKLHINRHENQVAPKWLVSIIKLALIKCIVELDLSTNYFCTNFFGLPFQDKGLKWCNLKKLKLKYIPIDDHTLSYMISSCPLLTYLHLEGCRGLKKFLAIKIPNLHELYLICTSDHPMEEVDFSAPKLEFFKSTNVRVVHIDECTSLKSLSLYYSSIEQERFQRFLSSCPFLEDLSLNWCGEIKTVLVSSHYFKSLRLNECHSLDTVDIDAPNLQLLEYINRHTKNSLPLVISRAARKARYCSITYCCENDTDLSQFPALRQLMTNFERSTLTVRSSSCTYGPYMLKKLRNQAMLLHPIYEHHFESLTLKYFIINEAEIERFLQMCRPKYFICEYLEGDHNHKIMRKLCVEFWTLNMCVDENLHDGGYGCRFRCRCRFDCQCWRHYIKEARICYVVGNRHAPLTYYDLVSLSTTSMTGNVKIYFALDWKQAPNMS